MLILIYYFFFRLEASSSEVNLTTSIRENDPSLKDLSNNGSSTAGNTTDNGPSWLVGETSTIQVPIYHAPVLEIMLLTSVVKFSLGYHIF